MEFCVTDLAFCYCFTSVLKPPRACLHLLWNGSAGFQIEVIQANDCTRGWILAPEDMLCNTSTKVMRNQDVNRGFPFVFPYAKGENMGTKCKV